MKTKPFFTTLIITLLVLAACQSAPPATPAPDVSVQAAPTEAPQPNVEEQNLAVVRRFYEEFSAGNADVILEVHPGTITMHYADSVDEVPAQLLRDDLAALKAANPDLRAEIHSMFADGNIVVTELAWTTTHTGDYFGIPASGQTTTHNGIVVRRLENGKIVESWEMWDDLAFFQSIGYLPSWDEIVANQGQAAASEVFISQPDQLAGIWRGRGGNASDPAQSYWWFKPDGTYVVTFDLEQFEAGYFVEAGKFGFDGAQLILEATSKGCAAVPDEVMATYEAGLALNADGTPAHLNLKPVSEGCMDRQNALGGAVFYVQAMP